jgi:hypothetical protein
VKRENAWATRSGGGALLRGDSKLEVKTSGHSGLESPI